MIAGKPRWHSAATRPRPHSNQGERACRVPGLGQRLVHSPRTRVCPGQPWSCPRCQCRQASPAIPALGTSAHNGILGWREDGAPAWPGDPWTLGVDLAADLSSRTNSQKKLAVCCPLEPGISATHLHLHSLNRSPDGTSLSAWPPRGPDHSTVTPSELIMSAKTPCPHKGSF